MAVAAIGAVFAGVGVAAGAATVGTMAMVGTALTVVGAVTKNKNLMSLGAGFGIGTLAGGAYASAVGGAAKDGLVGSAMQSSAPEAASTSSKVLESAGMASNGPASTVASANTGAQVTAAANTAASAGASAPSGFWNNLTSAQGQVLGGVLKGVGEGAASYLGAKEEQKAKQGLIDDQRRFASQVPTITRGSGLITSGRI